MLNLAEFQDAWVLCLLDVFDIWSDAFANGIHDNLVLHSFLDGVKQFLFQFLIFCWTLAPWSGTCKRFSPNAPIG